MSRRQRVLPRKPPTHPHTHPPACTLRNHTHTLLLSLPTSLPERERECIPGEAHRPGAPQLPRQRRRPLQDPLQQVLLRCDGGLCHDSHRRANDCAMYMRCTHFRRPWLIDCYAMKCERLCRAERVFLRCDCGLCHGSDRRATERMIPCRMRCTHSAVHGYRFLPNEV